MRGDTGIVAVYVHFRGGIDHFHFFADISARNAVIMGVLAQSYMSVFHDGQHSGFSKFVAYRIEFSQCRTFYFLELFPAAVVTPDKRRVIVYFQCHTDGRIQSGEVMEHAPFQVGIDTAVDKFDRTFHQGLVTRLISPGGGAD